MSAKKRLVILDTHAILHRAYHALPDFSSSKGMPTGALYGLLSMLVKIINDLRPDYMVAAIDLPGATFRDAAYEHYKAGRAETQDDLIEQIKRTPGVLEAFGVPVYSAKEFEADDVIGTIVEKVKNKKDLEVIIASGDKDALQLIEGQRVQVFTFGKGMNDTLIYDEAAVQSRYGFGPKTVVDLKGIAGDPSDNIKGVPGVGEGSALRLLQTYGSIKGIFAAITKEGVEAVAAKSGVQKRFVDLVAKSKKEAEFSKLLATIRRDAPIDFELPKKSWRDGADTKRVLDMLAEFEFRGLVPRVKNILGVIEAAAPEPAAAGEGLFKNNVAPGAFYKAQVAVSVLDSAIAEPSMSESDCVAKTTLAFFFLSVFSHSRSWPAKPSSSSASQPSSTMMSVGSPFSRSSMRWKR